ncbi:MAG: DoxX family protein [Cyclobacteriaceae bacterium]
MKTIRIAYYIVLSLFTLMMLFSVFNYFANHDAMAEGFEALGFPAYLVYPLAIAKALGVIAIWVKRPATLKEWAYAGFFYDFILAFSAHINAGDGNAMGPVVALVLLAAVYFLEKRLVAARSLATVA